MVYSYRNFSQNLVSDQAAFAVLIDGPRRWRLEGELDVAAASDIEAWLSARANPAEIDCSGLTFIDAAGLAVLLQLHAGCTARGARLALVDPPRCLTRVLELTGLEDVFDVRLTGPSR